MLSLFRSLFSHTSRRLHYKQSKHFSSKPLNTTYPFTLTASQRERLEPELKKIATHHLEQMEKYWKTQSSTEFQQNVGNLKESSRQMISSLQSLSILLMKESVQYLKVKTLTLKQRTVECMQQISLVTSKSKAFMLQTI